LEAALGKLRDARRLGERYAVLLAEGLYFGGVGAPRTFF
jgi:hypothetical protein